MQFIKSLKKQLFNLSAADFEQTALEVFRFQAVNNEVYRSYIGYLNINIGKVRTIEQIPFLPIEFFKNNTVRSSPAPVEAVFESSGTTGQEVSKHYMTDLDFYYRVSEDIFRRYYGELSDYHVLALLPSYLERNTSSLVYMVDQFIKKAAPGSGFYLHNQDDLYREINSLQQSSRKVLLIGVTFALLDFAEHYQPDLSKAIVMETGGMKGRRREMLRQEVHDTLKQAFLCRHIHSEYGMTELLSQCYAHSDGVFSQPPWVRVLLRNMNDPFEVNTRLKDGGINIIDLANIESCAFIETKDIGVLQQNGETFQVLGRYDYSDLRGCNLMVI